MGEVIIVGAICGNCGVATALRITREAEPQQFPVVVPVEWARQALECRRCDGRVRIATEPVAPTPAEAS